MSFKRIERHNTVNLESHRADSGNHPGVTHGLRPEAEPLVDEVPFVAFCQHVEKIIAEGFISLIQEAVLH